MTVPSIMEQSPDSTSLPFSEWRETPSGILQLALLEQQGLKRIAAARREQALIPVSKNSSEELARIESREMKLHNRYLVATAEEYTEITNQALVELARTNKIHESGRIHENVALNPQVKYFGIEQPQQTKSNQQPDSLAGIVSPLVDFESSRKEQYEELLTSDSIRILRLFPGDDSTPLAGTLYVTRLGDSSESFEALSYVWGSDQPQEVFLCNGKALAITKSLHTALQRFRLPGRYRSIWVDGICINQDDLAERKQQIKLMRRIFKDAARVLVWLGPDPEYHAPLAFRMICETVVTRMEVESRKNGLQGGAAAAAASSSVTAMNPKNEPTYLKANFITADGSKPTIIQYSPSLRKTGASKSLASFFQLPWFRRTWVLQEVALASSAVVIWGNASISWTFISIASSYLRYNSCELMRTEYMPGVLNAYFMYRIGRVQGGLDSIKLSFSSLLELTRNLKSTDPRDKIFGLLGIPTTESDPDSDQLIIEPDYRLTKQELYYYIACNILEGENSLDILSSVQNGSELGYQAPSWVPRWDETYTLTLLSSRRPSAKSASRGLQRSVAIRHIDQSISIHGIPVCSTTKVLSEMSAINFDGNNLMLTPIIQHIEELSPLFEQHSPASFIQMMNATLTAGKDWYGDLVGICSSDVSPNTRLADFMIYIVSCAAQLKETRRLGQTPYLSDPEKNFLAIVSDFTSKPKEYGSAYSSSGNLSRFFESAINGCLSRRLFLTSSNRLGLGPAAMRSGDVIAVFGGATMPFVIRPRPQVQLDDRDGQISQERWSLVGECYIYELMSGEAVENMQNDKLKAEEFILV